jgi:ureidoacrylate peracid hydrolase
MSTSTQKRTILIEAKPRAIKIDTGETAVLVVDMQNDYGAPGGMFDRAGIDISSIRRAVEPTRKVLETARKAGIPVIYVTMEYQPDLSDAGAADGPNRMKHDPFGLGKTITAPDGRPGRILIKGTWNTAIVKELAPQPGDRIVSKHRFSGFYETNLDQTLKAIRAKYLIVTGCTTSVCVDSTIRDAMFRGYNCILLADCTAEPLGAELPRGNYEAALLVIETLFGWVSTSEFFMQALEAR